MSEYVRPDGALMKQVAPFQYRAATPTPKLPVQDYSGKRMAPERHMPQGFPSGRPHSKADGCGSTVPLFDDGPPEELVCTGHLHQYECDAEPLRVLGAHLRPLYQAHREAHFAGRTWKSGHRSWAICRGKHKDNPNHKCKHLERIRLAAPPPPLVSMRTAPPLPPSEPKRPLRPSKDFASPLERMLEKPSTGTAAQCSRWLSATQAYDGWCHAHAAALWGNTLHLQASAGRVGKMGTSIGLDADGLFIGHRLVFTNKGNERDKGTRQLAGALPEMPARTRWDHSENLMLARVDAGKALYEVNARLGELKEHALAAIVHGETLKKIGGEMGYKESAEGKAKEAVLKALEIIAEYLDEQLGTPSMYCQGAILEGPRPSIH